MATSPRSESLLALGRKLVAELQLQRSGDTLGRWMAHYIAELIETAASAAPGDRAIAEGRCFEAILELWRHRSELPDGTRPFEDVEPIMRTIESLDPHRTAPRYHAALRSSAADAEKYSRISSCLEFAERLDATARVLIGCCLGDAAEIAIDDAKEWLLLTQAAEVDAGVHGVVVRFLSDLEVGASGEVDKDSVKWISHRVGQLEAFTKIATSVSRELRSRLNELQAPEESSLDDKERE